MVFFGAALIKQFGLMPENYITMINDVTNESTNTLTCIYRIPDHGFYFIFRQRSFT